MTKVAMNTNDSAKQHILLKHVSALVAVHRAALNFIKELHPDDLSPEETALAQALSDPILIGNKEALMLEMLEQIILFALPGPDIVSENIGISAIATKDRVRGCAIVMEVCPGKKIVQPMTREGAENFEKAFRKMLDEQFGRLIKL